MNSWARFFSTMVVWIMYGAIVAGVVAMAMAPSFDEEWIIAVVVLLVTIVAGYTSHAIWRFPQVSEETTTRSARGQSVKTKRGGRLARLVDDLSDDEIVELETLLLSRDETDYQQ